MNLREELGMCSASLFAYFNYISAVYDNDAFEISVEDLSDSINNRFSRDVVVGAMELMSELEAVSIDEYRNDTYFLTFDRLKAAELVYLQHTEKKEVH